MVVRRVTEEFWNLAAEIDALYPNGLPGGLMCGGPMTVRVGVACIVIKNRQILLGRRKGSFGAGQWAFLGGHLETGEMVLEAAQRELEEETGICATAHHMNMFTEDIFDEGRHYITIFTSFDVADEPKILEPHKCEEWRWFLPSQVTQAYFTDIQQELFLPTANFVARGGLRQFEW